jgi:beta propeller repeat protein
MVSESSRPGLRATIVLIIALVVAAAGTALLAPAAAPAAEPAAPVLFPICIELGGQAGPDIAGNMAVWTDNRRGNLDIYGRNLSTRKEYAVCTFKAQQDNPSVTRFVTAAGKVQYLAVWVDKRRPLGGTNTDIYCRNITLGSRSFRVSSGVVANACIKYFPEIVDKWVVWLETVSTGGYAVKARDMAAGTTYRVATCRVLSPLGLTRRTVGATTRHTVVYTSGAGNISGRDLPSGTPFGVSQTSRFEWSPDISANRVVWWEAGGRVMLRNLKTGKRTFVATGARPRVDGELVTWDGGGKGGVFALKYTADAAVYVRNVRRGTHTVKITRAHQTLLFPALSGNRLVFESGKATRVLSNIHIWGARL